MAYVDNWDGNKDLGMEFEMGKKMISNYLSLLDGKRHTQLLVIPEDRSNNLLIGGGRIFFVVTYTVGVDEAFYNLTNKLSNTQKEIEIVTGGQSGLFLEKYCMNFEYTLTVLHHYVETNAISDSSNYAWEKQI